MVALALLVMMPPLPLATTVLPIPVTKPLPFAYTGYQRFPVFYFGSRSEGLQTEAQLEVMAKQRFWEPGRWPASRPRAARFRERACSRIWRLFAGAESSPPWIQNIVL